MWKYKLPTEIVFGEGSSDNLGVLLAERGLKRALLLTSPGFVARGEAAAFTAASGGAVVGVASDIEPNPTIQNAESCARTARELGAECLVAIGGGSVMDCAKAVGVMLHDGCPAEALISGHRIGGMLPMVALPTTAGTASEVSGAAVLSWREKGRKSAFLSPALHPLLAVIDPILTYTCPPALTAASGVDALSHALDALGSVRAQPISDLLAVEAARLVFLHLRTAYASGDDPAAREGMARASLLAGMAFSQSGVSAAHACSYPLTVKYGIPHGEACAFTLDAWYALNARARPAMDDYAVALGFRGAEGLAAELNKLKRDLGLRVTLSDAGIGDGDLEALAEGALQAGAMKNNVVQLDRQGIIDLYLRKC